MTENTSYPTPVTMPLNKSTLTINTRCATCKHFNRLANPAYGEVCSQLGVIETSKPCNRYSVNPAEIKIYEQEHVEALVEIVESLSDRDLQLMAALFNREHLTRKRGFKFGSVVYLRPFGGDYVSNYRKAKVISADREYVHIRAADGWTASVFHTSVLNAAAWKAKKADLTKAGKIKDPNYSKYFQIKTKAQVDIEKFHSQGNEPISLDRSVRRNSKTLLTTEGIEEKKKSLRTTPVDELLKVRG